MGKTRSTTTVKKKKGYSSSSTLQPVRSTRSTNPHPLILPLPLEKIKKDKKEIKRDQEKKKKNEEKKKKDQERRIRDKEKKRKDEETKKNQPGPNERRKARHEDVLRRLQSIIKDKDHQTQERPCGGAGGLFRIPYKNTYSISPFVHTTRKMNLRDFVLKEKYDEKKRLWKEVEVYATDEELHKFRDEVLSERPYVAFSSEGMRKKKVVLGNLYINQGDLDFVYLNLREQSSVFGGKALVAAATEGWRKEENYFSLEESKNGDIWISIDDGVEGVQPSSSTLVSVNGDALGNGTSLSSLGGKRRKLEFGDIVTISTNKGEKEEEWERTDFLFMMPLKGQVTNPINGGSKSSPLDNPQILATVLSFLPTNEVKKARGVSHLWNEEGLQALRKRTQEVAIKVIDQVVIGSGDGLRSMTVFHPLPDPLLKFPNWKVALPGSRRDWVRGTDSFHFRTSSKDEEGLVTLFVANLELKRTRTTEQKILDDMKGLFGSQKHVESLCLDVFAEREAHLRMLEIMLERVKDTLKTLRLTFGLPSWPSIPFSPSSMVEFPCLSHLSLELDINNGPCFSHSSHYRAQHQTFGFLASFLLPVVGNIESLTILDRFLSSEALEEIARMQNRKEPSAKFGRLSQVQIQDCSDKALKALTSLRKNSLRTLELQGILPEDTSLLQHVLEGFSESLQELRVEFNFRPDKESRILLNIKFPVRMRNLTALSVLFRSKWMDLSRIHVHFGQLGPNEEDHQRTNHDIDYARHFPSLVNLTVSPVDRVVNGSEVNFQINERTRWSTFLPVVSAFLPTQQRVPSITTLDIPFLLRGKYHPVLDNLETIFPSVVFPQEEGLTQARGGPIWTKSTDCERI